MSSHNYSVILFPSTGYAIQGERLLDEQGIVHRMIPVPRSIASTCGSCIRIKGSDSAAAQQILTTEGLSFERIVALEE